MNTLKLSILLFFGGVSVAQSQTLTLPSGPSYFYECRQAESLSNFQACLENSVDKCSNEQASIATQCKNLQRVMIHGLGLTLARSSVLGPPAVPTIVTPRETEPERGGGGWGYSKEEIFLLALGQTKLNKLRNQSPQFGQQYDVDIMNGTIFNPFYNLNESQKKSIMVELSPGNVMDLNSILTKIAEDQDFLANSSESNIGHAIKVKIDDPAVTKSIEDNYINQLDSLTFDSALIYNELESIE